MARSDLFRVSSLALTAALVTGCSTISSLYGEEPQAPAPVVAAAEPAPIAITEAPLNEALRTIVPGEYTVALDPAIKPELYLVAVKGLKGDWRQQLDTVASAQGLRYREDGKTVFVAPASAAPTAVAAASPAAKKNDTREDDLSSAVPFEVVDVPPPAPTTAVAEPTKLAGIASGAIPAKRPSELAMATAAAEMAKIEAASAEAARQAAARAEAEKALAAKLEAERAAAAQQEAEKVAAAKAEAERVEAEKAAALKLEAEKAAAAKAEAAKLAAEEAETARLAEAAKKPSTRPLAEVLNKLYPKAKVVAASDIDLKQQVVWQPEQDKQKALAAITATSNLSFEADDKLIFVRRGLSSREMAPIVAAAIAEATPVASAEPAPVAKLEEKAPEAVVAKVTPPVELTPATEEMVAKTSAALPEPVKPAEVAVAASASSTPKPVAFYKPAEMASAPAIESIAPSAAPPAPAGAPAIAAMSPVAVPEAVKVKPDPVAAAIATAAPIAADMTAPVGSNFAASVKPPTQPKPAVWTAARGDTLRSVLQQWCDIEGVQLNWDTEFDFPLEASIDVNGKFESAVRTILTGFSMASPQPIGRLHRQANMGKGVLVIQTRGNRYEN